MAITLSGDHAIASPPLSARLTTPQVWGIVLLAPYLLVFLAFVVYPVGYGLWLARHPASYVALWHDPIFARAAVNTLSRRADGVMHFVESYRQISRAPQVRKRPIDIPAWGAEIESLFRA